VEAAFADTEWTDAARDRAIPVRVYLPAGEGPAPVVVLSHATGGSREDYAYLGRAWAEHGYVSVHLQHRGSDVDCWRGKGGGALPAMRRAAEDPQSVIDRVADVRFALDRIEDGDRALGGRADPGRVGMCGHSLGARTALVMAGEVHVTRSGEQRCAPDPRPRAVIAMSSPRPWSTRPGDVERAFAAVRVPCLHFTGTLDDSPLNDTRASERRIPFDHLRGADQLLVTFAGGDHTVFVGSRRLFGGGPRDGAFHAVVRRASLAFWDAYLRDDAEASRWMFEGGLAELLGEDGMLEVRRSSA
jgi:predicted dienelactone hydrolase